MRTQKRLLVAILLLILLSVAALLLFYPGTSHVFELELTGLAGQRYVGTITVDGMKERIVGPLPASFRRTGRRFEFAAAQTRPEVEKLIQATVYLEGERRLYCTAQGVTGEIGERRGLLRVFHADWVSALSADEITQLAKE